MRWTCLASSVVTTSLVMIRILSPRSIRRGVIASTIAVLPEPTGPPTPILVIFFILIAPTSVHEHADMRVQMRGRNDIGQGVNPAI